MSLAYRTKKRLVKRHSMVRKLDVQVKTAMGKEETLSTAQLDFLLPERLVLILYWSRW